MLPYDTGRSPCLLPSVPADSCIRVSAVPLDSYGQREKRAAKASGQLRPKPLHLFLLCPSSSLLSRKLRLLPPKPRPDPLISPQSLPTRHGFLSETRNFCSPLLLPRREAGRAVRGLQWLALLLDRQGQGVHYPSLLPCQLLTSNGLVPQRDLRREAPRRD